MSYAQTKVVSDEQTTIISHTQDCEPILEENKRLKDMHGGENLQDMRHAARIPMALLEKWRNEEGLDYHLVGRCPEMTGRFWKKLQSPEYRDLRIWEGRVV